MQISSYEMGQSVFDRYAEEYDNWYERNKFAYLSELEALRRVTPKRGEGLEIGVGTGRFAQVLKVPVGLDVSANMLRIAKNRGIKTVVGKGENLPFDADEFNFVLIMITLCFVENADQVIAESRRVIKNKGKIVIGIIDKDSHLGRDYKDKKKQKRRFYRGANFYSPEEVIELLERYEFKNILTFQSIFQPLERIKQIEKPEEGFGKGGFVVICGKKSGCKQGAF